MSRSPTVLLRTLLQEPCETIVIKLPIGIRTTIGAEDLLATWHTLRVKGFGDQSATGLGPMYLMTKKSSTYI